MSTSKEVSIPLISYPFSESSSGFMADTGGVYEPTFILSISLFAPSIREDSSSYRVGTPALYPLNPVDGKKPDFSTNVCSLFSIYYSLFTLFNNFINLPFLFKDVGKLPPSFAATISLISSVMAATTKSTIFF